MRSSKEKVVKMYFDPVPHRYTDEEGTEYTSVTTFLDEFKEKYDTEYWAIYRALEQAEYVLRPYTNTREISIKHGNKFYRLSLNRIKEAVKDGRIKLKKSWRTVKTEWKKEADEACAVGSEKHDYLEECINRFYGEKGHSADSIASFTVNIPRTAFTSKLSIRTLSELEDSPLKESDPRVYDILKRAVNAGYTLYAEVRVYSYEYKISGTIDVFAVKGNDFVIIDWKTNKAPLKFYSGYYKKVWNEDRTEKVKTDKFVKTDDTFFAPINHIPLCKGEIYTLQLSLYAKLCELWGFNCKGLVLCHLLGTRNEGAKTVIYSNIKYRKDAVEMMLTHRLNKLQNKFTRTI